ncbi:hypothetical protein HC891_06985, partial [Candidatus Gracilibacteria bacterium]|nr:hypothetical protein [Candidatus Gracilibacteria bacterium]
QRRISRVLHLAADDAALAELRDDLSAALGRHSDLSDEQRAMALAELLRGILEQDTGFRIQKVGQTQGHGNTVTRFYTDRLTRSPGHLHAVTRGHVFIPTGSPGHPVTWSPGIAVQRERPQGRHPTTRSARGPSARGGILSI